MNHQLPLAIHLNHQASLADFCWGDNIILQQQLQSSLHHQGERFLYLWGSPGCGKSHLLQACCQELSRYPSSSTTYLPLRLLKEWGPNSIDGIEEQTLIAIDDIDAIKGDKAWEEALFHLYNRVRDQEHTLLLITGLGAPSTNGMQLADLRSRLSSGVTIQIHELSDELKVTVLQQQAQKRGFKLPQSAALFLINRSARSMHTLHHMLDRLDEASLVAQRKITIPFVKSILGI